MIRNLHLIPMTADEARPLLETVLRPGLDTSGGLVSVKELLTGAECTSVTDDAGHQVGAYAIEFIDHDGGRDAVIVAAVGGLRGVDLTASVLPGIINQAKNGGACRLRFHTKRRGLLAKLRAQGFEFSGYIMSKAL